METLLKVLEVLEDGCSVNVLDPVGELKVEVKVELDSFSREVLLLLKVSVLGVLLCEIVVESDGSDVVLEDSTELEDERLVDEVDASDPGSLGDGCAGEVSVGTIVVGGAFGIDVGKVHEGPAGGEFGCVGSEFGGPGGEVDEGGSVGIVDEIGGTGIIGPPGFTIDVEGSEIGNDREVGTCSPGKDATVEDGSWCPGFVSGKVGAVYDVDEEVSGGAGGVSEVDEIGIGGWGGQGDGRLTGGAGGFISEVELAGDDDEVSNGRDIDGSETDGADVSVVSVLTSSPGSVGILDDVEVKVEVDELSVVISFPAVVDTVPGTVSVDNVTLVVVSGAGLPGPVLF
ncbi:hypothetical protein ABKA04_003335 [Annulohypoxylon sp. FPYF3050]